MFFFFKQKTAYEMRISDWSSDVCSSDLVTSSLLADYRRTEEQEKALQAKVEQLKGDYLDLRRRSIQYNIYQPEVDTNQALYDRSEENTSELQSLLRISYAGLCLKKKIHSHVIYTSISS